MVAKRGPGLCGEILRAKYLPRGHSFFGCQLKQGDSYVWTKEIIYRGGCYHLGDGWTIDPNHDPWISWVPGRKALLKEGVSINRVSFLKSEANAAWHLDRLKLFYNEAEMEDILQMAWTQENKEDELLWLANPDGCFSVKSCFKILEEEDNSEVWKAIWKARLHERCKLFLWRAMSNIIPTKWLKVWLWTGLPC